MTTPNDVQNQINAVPWTNGKGLVTGATIMTLLTAIVALFANYAPISIVTATAANNTALQMLSTANYTQVNRLGYAAAGDSPPLLYAASNSACSLNDGTGDGGSQVPSANGKCWLAQFADGKIYVASFGCDQTGVVDCSGAAQYAVNAAGLSNAKEVIFTGSVKIASTVNIQSNYIQIEGGGANANAGIIFPTGNLNTFYVSSTDGTPLYGVNFRNISFYRNDNPSGGACIAYNYTQYIHSNNVQISGCYVNLYLASTQLSEFNNFTLTGCSSAANGAGLSIVRNASLATVQNSSVLQFTSLDIEGNTDAITNRSTCPTTHDNIRITNGDGITVTTGHAYAAGRDSLLIQPQTSGDALDNIVFGNFNFDSATLHGVQIEGPGLAGNFGIFDFSGATCELAGSDCFHIGTTAGANLVDVKGVGMHFLDNSAVSCGVDLEIGAGEKLDFSGSTYTAGNWGTVCSPGATYIFIGGATSNVNISGSMFAASAHGTTAYNVSLGGSADYVTGNNMNFSGTAAFDVYSTSSGTHNSVGNNSVTDNPTLLMLRPNGFAKLIDFTKCYALSNPAGCYAATGATTLMTLTPSSITSGYGDVLVSFKMSAASSGSYASTGMADCVVASAAPSCGSTTYTFQSNASRNYVTATNSSNNIVVQAATNAGASTAAGSLEIEVLANGLFGNGAYWTAQ